MYTLMLPPGMVCEFQEIYNAEKSARGTLSARTYALAKMISTRREHLTEYMEVYPLEPSDTFYADTVKHEVTRLTAELTLLMIERGA